MVGVTGTPANDFKITVKGKSGELIYESSDAGKAEHYFNAVEADKSHTLSIVNAGQQVTHKF